MPVVFDTGFIIRLLDNKAPVTGAVRRALKKLEGDLQKAAERIVIPTPALTEFLMKVDNPAAYVEHLNRSRHFQIAPFGERAAVEMAARQAEAANAGDARSGTGAPWNKMKFDRQIVAIASVERATAIYSIDADIPVYAKPYGIPVITLDDLPAPDQGEMFDDEG